MVESGDCGGLPHERRMDHASGHRDCRSRTESCRLLLAFVGRLQVDAAGRASSARIDTARRRCAYLPRTGLQDALYRQHPDARRKRFHRQLRDGQVPAGHSSGTRDPCVRRLDVERIGEDRSQSDRRRAAADGPAAEAGPESAPSKKAQAAQGRRRPTGRWRVPRPDASACGPAGSGGRTTAASAAARPLIACTAPEDNCTGPKCRLCRDANMPTLRLRAPSAHLTAAAPKGTFE